MKGISTLIDKNTHVRRSMIAVILYSRKKHTR